MINNIKIELKELKMNDNNIIIIDLCTVSWLICIFWLIKGV